MQSTQLLQSLIEQTREMINQAERLKNYDLRYLSWRAEPASWTILECLEHLNLYGDFYLPQIESKIKNPTSSFEAEFTPGWLGDYFAKSMLPKEKLNKMKTFKDKNPLNVKPDANIIDRFISQQVKLLDLLSLAPGVSLNKIKISTSISKLIKLKLGDTFRFFVNHNARHLEQVKKIQAAMEKQIME